MTTSQQERAEAPAGNTPRTFCAIAAVDNREILEGCLKRSPDIQSGQIPLIEIEGASNMAEAYNSGLEQTDADICLFVHQDVYLPRGWLDKARKVLGDLDVSHPDWLVAGPDGKTPDNRHVSRIWDVTLNREVGGPGFGPTAVGAFDELLLILRREDGFRFDPDLPHFHMYGTDLVQTALEMGRGAYAVELPVVHNNRPIVSLGGGYLKAYRYARRKWRSKLPIYTTICAVTYNPFPLWRARFRRRHVKERGPALQADSREVAIKAGYEEPAPDTAELSSDARKKA